ncbi:sensor domain-containing protein [Solemya velum gill symbiont]|nr:GGDEF domain-containing phosphodiesterase [Solemya velum gill symbiont]
MSDNVENQLGYSPETFTSDSGFWHNHIHPEDCDWVLNSLDDLFEKGRHIYKYRFLHADGKYRWMYDTLFLTRDDAGEPKEIVGYWIDITDLVESKGVHEAIFKYAVDGAILIDESSLIKSFSPAAEKLFGYTEKEVFGKNISMLMPQPFQEEHDGYVKRYLDTGKGRIIGVGPREVSALKKDGSVIPIDLVISEAIVGTERLFLGIVRDISERKQAHDDLLNIANYDQLTGLPNRTLFHERLRHAIARSERNETLIALFYIDLDRFKQINDSLGHDAGDQLLRLTAERLQSNTRKSDTVARLSGDEFAVILEDVDHISIVTKVAQKIVESLSRSATLNGREIHPGASIGVTLYPMDDKLPEDLMKDADMAMYRAKEMGGSQFQYYSQQLGASVQHRIELEFDLRSAIKKEEFVLHFQPQAELLNGRIIGAEALLRWNHPKLGLVSPATFVPVLEEMGLITDVGNWVLRESCRHLRAWRRLGFDHLKVSVNVSPKQFKSWEFLGTVQNVIRETGVPPNCIELEITESLVMDDPENAVYLLKSLHELGVEISIDDFGTGYSSLSNLKSLPFDTLKIDRAFIKELPDDTDSATICRTIIALADALNLKTVAEGVEKLTQLKFLKRNGCNSIQGFYFSKPTTHQEFEKLLLEGKCLSVSDRHGDIIEVE